MSEPGKPALELPVSQYLEERPLEDRRALLWARVRARREHSAVERGARADAGPALPVPLAATLVDADQLSIPRAHLFRRVRARVRRPRSRAIPRPLLIGMALVGVVGCLLIAWRGARFLPADAAGALLCADGEPLGPLAAGARGQTVRLADQSEIRLSPGARIEPLLSSATRFELLLTRGSAEFSVTPGGPRRWLVEAGAARVEVVGTVFRVSRLPDSVGVAVSRGAVLVVGEQVPGRVQRLGAGQRLFVPALRASPEASAAGAAADSSFAQPPASKPIPGAEVPPVPPLAVRSPDSGPRASRPKRATRVASGLFDPQADPHASYASLGAAGMARETMQAEGIEALLELADVARLSGHPQDAVAPLNRALDHFRSSPQAGLAAFTLGRVLLEQLSAPAAAAEAFERAISLYLPRTLLSDCYRRLAEAYDRAGNHQARDEVAARFRAAFPGEAQERHEAAPR